MKAEAKDWVFVVDDDEVARDALSMVLRTAGYHVESLASATQFLHQYRPQQSGCLILDVRMPGMSGLELQDQLLQSGSPLPIIFLTAHGDVPTAVRAMKRGAFEFLQKPVEDRQLLSAVDHALAFAAQRRGKSRRGEPHLLGAESLSAREREVLALILTGKQTRAIAEQLFISYKTVEFHRGRIFRKLGVSSLAGLFSLCFANSAARQRRS